MGSGISDNYVDIQQILVIGYWNVHTAIRKLTNEPVSLWIIDQERLKGVVKKKGDRELLLKQYLESIQRMRRICHPHVLKVHEMSEDISSLSFSAEPIKLSLIYEDKFSNDEITYIAMQLSETLHFLHTTAKIASLTISQSSIVLTNQLDVKICDFSYSAGILNQNGLVESNIGQWTGALTQPQIAFCAPEILTGKQVTTAADAFGFGALVLSLFLRRIAFGVASPNDLINQIQAAAMLVPKNVEAEMKNLIVGCLNPDFSKRPSFEEINKSAAFNGIEMKVLRYIDIIITKQASDKFEFFKNLPSALVSFSKRILRNKFAPLFIKEVQDDVRFGPILIPLTVKIGADFENEEFYKEIVQPLGPYLNCINPPEVLSGVFSVIDIFISRIDKDKHYDIIYPFFISALQSNSTRLHKDAIVNMPIMIGSMASSSIQSSLIPKLLEFVETASDVHTISSCIMCMKHAVEKIDQEWFAQYVIPKLSETITKKPNPEIGVSISSVLEILHPSIELTLKYLIPLASQVLVIKTIEPENQNVLCSIISTAIERIKRERRLESKWAQNAKVVAKKNIVPEEKPFEIPSSNFEIEEERSPTQKTASIPLDDETSTDIFGTSTSVQNKQRPLVLPKKNIPVIPSGSSTNSEETKKTSSMFSGLNVNTGSAKKTTGWKRGKT